MPFTHGHQARQGQAREYQWRRYQAEVDPREQRDADKTTADTARDLDNGTGTWYTDAPALAGMSDWYFVTQISNFRAGIRSLHSDDYYGEQMVGMSTAMSGTEEIEDVAAYINTLK